MLTRRAFLGLLVSALWRGRASAQPLPPSDLRVNNMAVTQNPLTVGGSATNGTSYITASITPGVNLLILLAIEIDYVLAQAPPAPALTISGNGLTWVLIAADGGHFVSGSSYFNYTYLYRSMGASPSTGGITIGTTPTADSIRWSVSEYDGVDTSGTNGSGAIVQNATNRAENVTTLTVTLGAFGDSGNATYGAFGAGDTSAAGDTSFTPGTGFTEIHDAATEYAALGTEWRSDNDTSVDTTASKTIDLGGVAVEIKAAAAAAAGGFRSRIAGGLVVGG